tara:strand:- start:21 stop:185 length:165 start_codon:yes stop_codon:yes gene_type:complete
VGAQKKIATFSGKTVYLKSLIMAQIERWRQASYMQVERESIFGCEYSGGRVSNT